MWMRWRNRTREAVPARSGDQGLQGRRGRDTAAVRAPRPPAAGVVVGGSGSGWSRDMAQC